jgi:two-component system chemotaxis response regulator CheB
MTEAPVRVLICEDSRTYAAALQRLLEHDGDITVAGVVGTGEQAIAALPRLDPSIVTMDLELPGMSGLEAIEQIMGSRPVPICTVSSMRDYAGAALAAGALDAFDKSDLGVGEPEGPAAAAFRRRVKLLSRVRVIRHPRGPLAARRLAARATRKASVIGVCASTGGPQLLVQLLDVLPADYPVPLLVVQHIAAGFTDGLARWLDKTVAVPVRVAEAGVPAERGVWIGPEGGHLKFDASGVLVVDRQTDAGVHRPSGDVLFESIAAAAGPTGVAVVLSGMGVDGAAGAAAVKQRGGLAIAQDEASSVVYGMPRAAVQHGVDIVLSPTEIAERLLLLEYEPLAART